MDQYSRLISVLKITLPLAALAILSTFFLFSQTSSEEGNIPFAELENIARQSRMNEPQYAGISEGGALLDIKATQMRPLAGNQTHLTKPAGQILAASGAGYSFYSAEGLLDDLQGEIGLNGLVHLETDNGYLMETHNMRFHMRDDLLNAPNPLEVRSPFGTLTAGQLTAYTGKDARMEFTGGVRLLYLRPEPETEGSPR